MGKRSTLAAFLYGDPPSLPPKLLRLSETMYELPGIVPQPGERAQKFEFNFWPAHFRTCAFCSRCNDLRCVDCALRVF